MLYDFLKTNRAELIKRCQAKADKRVLPGMASAKTEYGIPQFLTQLTEIFRIEQTPEALALHKAMGRGRPSLALVPADIAGTAAKHGDDLRRQGLTIDQVVHAYGDVCQALTELALEKDAPITVDEFHTFNRCLDDAIADAVTSFARHAGDPIPKTEVRAANEPRSPAQEMRDLVETAILSFAAIKGGNVALRGATSSVHEKSLVAMRDLIDRALRDANPDRLRAIISPAAPR